MQRVLSTTPSTLFGKFDQKLDQVIVSIWLAEKKDIAAEPEIEYVSIETPVRYLSLRNEPPERNSADREDKHHTNLWSTFVSLIAKGDLKYLDDCCLIGMLTKSSFRPILGEDDECRHPERFYTYVDEEEKKTESHYAVIPLKPSIRMSYYKLRAGCILTRFDRIAESRWEDEWVGVGKIVRNILVRKKENPHQTISQFSYELLYQGGIQGICEWPVTVTSDKQFIQLLINAKEKEMKEFPYVMNWKCSDESDLSELQKKYLPVAKCCVIL